MSADVVGSIALMLGLVALVASLIFYVQDKSATKMQMKEIDEHDRQEALKEAAKKDKASRKGEG